MQSVLITVMAKYFRFPRAFSYGKDLVKILSLDGSGKMSKSEQQMNTIYLNDDDELITKKIMKAKTDQGPIRTQ